MECKYCAKGTDENVKIHEKQCPLAYKQKFTDPFLDELCPKCRNMHKSHAIVNKSILICMNPTCGILFAPKAERERLRKISGNIKWKR